MVRLIYGFFIEFARERERERSEHDQQHNTINSQFFIWVCYCWSYCLFHLSWFLCYRLSSVDLCDVFYTTEYYTEYHNIYIVDGCVHKSTVVVQCRCCSFSLFHFFSPLNSLIRSGFVLFFFISFLISICLS